jgi:hypothetical protein
MTENMDADDFERASDLRQASDTLMQRLDRLYELESRKRELSPERPEFIRLAREIEDLARALLFSSGQEVELAEAVHADIKAGGATADVSIRDTPPKRDAVGVLAEWRAAERRLQAAIAGSAEEDEARREVERLRTEYRLITAPTPPENPA